MSSFAEPTRITDLFVRLGEDGSLLARFLRNPRAVLAESGLDEQAIQVVLAGDLTAVRSAVVEEIERDPRRRHLVGFLGWMIQWRKKKKPQEIKPDDPNYPAKPTGPSTPSDPKKDDEPGEKQGD